MSQMEFSILILIFKYSITILVYSSLDNNKSSLAELAILLFFMTFYSTFNWSD